MSATPPESPIVSPKPIPLVLATPQYRTIQDAKAGGALPGTPLRAPLAPAAGPIDGIPESLVVVTVKTFFGSPTGKAVVAILSASGIAILAAFSAALLNVWGAGKSLLDPGAIDWRATERVCEIAGGTALVAGIFGWLKTHDNNPVNLTTPKPQ